MSPSYISGALRQRAAAAAYFRCGYCLTSQRIIGPLLEIDHIVPEARGGTSDEENLWLACPMCNSHKADRQEAIDPESHTISFELEGIDSVHEVSIASQRCNGLGGVAVDETRDVLLEGSETRSDAGVQDVDAAFQVLPQAFDRI